MFNCADYFKNLHDSHVDLSDYHFGRVSGLSYLEDLIMNAGKYNKYFLIDDTDEGYSFKGGGYQFYHRRTYTVFILQKYNFNDMAERETKMNQAREIYRDLLSKMMYDEASHQNGLDYLNTSRVSFNEFPGYYANGVCGLYFQFSVDNPVNLEVDGAKWNG